jgi:peptidoglycan/LPS O-acetylase OafA/YrhL
LIIPPLPINQKAFDLAAVLFCFPVIVFWGASCTPSPRVSQIFLFLGSASYAVYVLQWPVFRVTTAILSRLASEWIVLGMCNVIVITIIATIADKYFDVPVRAKLSKWIAQV